jgi:hypothetical protein
MDLSWVMSVPEIRPPCENVDVVHPPKGRCHALAKAVKIIPFFAHDWRTEMAFDPRFLARWLAVQIQQHGPQHDKFVMLLSSSFQAKIHGTPKNFILYIL